MSITLPGALASQISRIQVPVTPSELHSMLGTVHAMHRLIGNPRYREAIADVLPVSALRDPGYPSVMMGYDFHLSPSGPKLIEINTNAGGGILAYAADRGAIPEELPTAADRRVARFLEQFAGVDRSGLWVIADERPQEQFLYPEMALYAELLEKQGLRSAVADPADLVWRNDALWLGKERVSLVYNRDCDFYFDTDRLVALKSAYEAGVAVSPHPFAYGHLADKGRMICLSEPGFLEACGAPEPDQELLGRVVPRTMILTPEARDTLWQERNRWFFKPATGFGSRGVLAGRKISRKRFDELPDGETLAQEYIPPAEIEGYKFDVRVFACGGKSLGVTARLYQGQVTNLRTEGGGFAKVVVNRLVVREG